MLAAYFSQVRPDPSGDKCPSRLTWDHCRHGHLAMAFPGHEYRKAVVHHPLLARKAEVQAYLWLLTGPLLGPMVRCLLAPALHTERAPITVREMGQIMPFYLCLGGKINIPDVSRASHCSSLDLVLGSLLFLLTLLLNGFCPLLVAINRSYSFECMGIL